MPSHREGQMVGRWESPDLRNACAASVVIWLQQKQWSDREVFMRSVRDCFTLPTSLMLFKLLCCLLCSYCNRTLLVLLSPPPRPPPLCLCFQVCHHPDCLDLNSKSPLHLCESCDSRCHSENTDNMHFDRHPRFDLQPQGSAAVFSCIWWCHTFCFIADYYCVKHQEHMLFCYSVSVG